MIRTVLLAATLIAMAAFGIVQLIVILTDAAPVLLQFGCALLGTAAACWTLRELIRHRAEWRDVQQARRHYQTRHQPLRVSAVVIRATPPELISGKGP